MMRPRGASLLELLVAFSVFVLILNVYFMSLGTRVSSERHAAYASRANALARGGLAKAKALTIGQAVDESETFEGLLLKIHYESKALESPENLNFRELQARVTVTRPPDDKVLYQTWQAQRCTDVEL
jgi:hypothetical protein